MPEIGNNIPQSESRVLRKIWATKAVSSFLLVAGFLSGLSLGLALANEVDKDLKNWLMIFCAAINAMNVWNMSVKLKSKSELNID